jgi:hypothetical protein
MCVSLLNEFSQATQVLEICIWIGLTNVTSVASVMRKLLSLSCEEVQTFYIINPGKFPYTETKRRGDKPEGRMNWSLE